MRGKQAIKRSGNKRLRRTLYLATLRAPRFNPCIKAFDARLRAAGKPTKVARCAAARKLLPLAWAVVTKGCAFDPAYQPRALGSRVARRLARTVSPQVLTSLPRTCTVGRALLPGGRPFLAGEDVQQSRPACPPAPWRLHGRASVLHR